MSLLAFADAVDIGGGRGRLAAPAAASLARVDAAFRSAFGRAADINEAWRSPEQADKNYRAYVAYLAGRGPWAALAFPAATSIHCRGYALDTDDTSTAHMRIWNEHGWFWTVYRNGKLIERWHLEYDAPRDKHRNEPAPAGMEEDMPLTDQDVVKILDAEFQVTDAKGATRTVRVKHALGYAVLGHDATKAVPSEVWGHRLPHPIAKKDGVPSQIPAGDFLRFEPAEHANTRTAVAIVATGDIDYDRIASEIAKRYPSLDVHALAIAAADEADRRERQRLGS